MAYQTGLPTWNLGSQPDVKPILTKEMVQKKGLMIAERYQKLLVALTAAGLELANDKDPLGLKLLAQAAESALEIGVKVCAANMGADLDG